MAQQYTTQGTSGFSNLLTPNTHHGLPGKYDLTFLLDEKSKECKDFIKMHTKLLDAYVARYKKNNPTKKEGKDFLIGVPYQAELEREKNEDTGKWEETGDVTGKMGFTFRSARSPSLFDSAGKKFLPPDEKWFLPRGSTVRVAFGINEWAVDKSIGVSFYLNGVQIITVSEASFEEPEFAVVDGGFVAVEGGDEGGEGIDSQATADAGDAGNY